MAKALLAVVVVAAVILAFYIIGSVIMGIGRGAAALFGKKAPLKALDAEPPLAALSGRAHRNTPKDVLREQCFRSSEESAARLWKYNVVLPLRSPPDKLPWQNLFDAMVRRPTAADREIQVAELDGIQRLGGMPLQQRLQHRRTAIASLEDYPVPPPKALTTFAPEMPVFITEDDMKRILPNYDLSDDDKEKVTSNADQINAKVEEAFVAARERYEAVQAEVEEEQGRMLAVWREHKRQWQQERLSEIRDIDQCAQDLNSSDDIEFLTEMILASSRLPRWVPHNTAAMYDKSTHILIVELQLPNVEEITFLKQVEMKRGLESKPVNQKEHKAAAAKLYPLLALRVATDLARQLPEGVVEFIAVNGWVDFRSKSTGALQRAYCAALGAKTADLKQIELEHVDPIVAFSSLKGNSSRSTELTPIAPTVRIDLDDPRYVDSREILRNMEAGENLASMDWEDFEHLCRELFERVFAAKGATVKVTQASRDQGVDAVIHDPDPIMGGRIVIQAKRYVNVVDVSAVRDLAGTVAHEGAMKGLLITTSHFGPDAYAFVQGKPLQLINGAELLGLLEKHGYKFRIDLEEARRIQREAGTPGFAKR